MTANRISEDSPLKVHKSNHFDFIKLTDKAVKNEENLALENNLFDDKEIFHKITLTLRSTLTEILLMKQNGQYNELDLEELRKKVCMLLLDLKKLNRVDKFRCRNIRDKVLEAKQKLDIHHLQLHNLLYESKFLTKEINKCLEFRSKVEDIELIDTETFLKIGPKDIIENEDIVNDQHKCMIERLKFELEERIKLLKELEVKAVEKREKIYEVESRRNCVDNFKTLLSSVINSVKPLHKIMEIPEPKLDE